MLDALLAVVLVLGACSAPREPPPPPASLRRDLTLTPEQDAYLRRLAAEADAQPNSFEARKASGMAHLRFTLGGALGLRDRAEADLEAAFALRPEDRELTRTLGRFYNLRAVAGDRSKAEMQVEVYRAYLGADPIDPRALDTEAFVAWSFSRLGFILSLRNEGALLKALGAVKDLEAALAERVAAQPDDVELRALAGNFAFFFAGNIPFDRKARVEAAVGYFEVLRRDWDELRPGARDPFFCPNTRENFMFELAEGYTVLERLEEARGLYEELSQIREPRTRAKEQIAWISRERLRNLPKYAGEMKLMPPWPSDVGNCVVCHAHTADIPLTSLYAIEEILLDDIPSEARPADAPLDGPLPSEVRSIVNARCAPCHFEGGIAASLADFTTDAGVQLRRAFVDLRVMTDEMPPSQPLKAEEKEVIHAWATRR